MKAEWQKQSQWGDLRRTREKGGGSEMERRFQQTEMVGVGGWGARWREKEIKW